MKLKTEIKLHFILALVAITLGVIFYPNVFFFASAFGWSAAHVYILSERVIKN